jgi:hypothetical protein
MASERVFSPPRVAAGTVLAAPIERIYFLAGFGGLAMTRSGCGTALGYLGDSGRLEFRGWLNWNRIENYQTGPVRPHFMDQFAISL